MVYSELSSVLFVQATLKTKLTTIIVRLNTRLPTSQPLNSNCSIQLLLFNWLSATDQLNSLYSTASRLLSLLQMSLTHSQVHPFQLPECCKGPQVWPIVRYVPFLDTTYITYTSYFAHVNDYDFYSSSMVFTLKVNCLRRTIVAKDSKEYYVCVEKLMWYQSLAFRHQTFNLSICLIKFYQKFWIPSVLEK
jgi:hypothetical protein